MAGAFQTSRDIFDNPIWNDVPKFRIFFYIYGNAVFSEDGVKVGGIRLERGQYLRSFRNLQKDLEFLENRSIKTYSLSVIKRKVDQLVKEDRLKIEDTELGTLFTVVNYASYQGLSNYKTNNENAERTGLERSENGDGTQRERSENNNNKDNKVKKVKKKYGDFVLLKDDEFQKLVSSFGENAVSNKIEDMNLYIGAKGIKYKSHYSALLNWFKRDGVKPKEDKPSTEYKSDSVEDDEFTSLLKG